MFTYHDYVINLTIITVRDMVSRETPPKNDAAPINANAPGSTQTQYEVGSVVSSNIPTIAMPTIRP